MDGRMDAATRLRLLEEELRRSEELLNDIGDMARVGGWEIDLAHDRVYWTRATKRIHEVPDDYQPSLDEALDFFPEARAELSAALRRVREEGGTYDLVLPFVTARGRKLWTRTIGRAEFEDGRCVRLHGTFQDISEQKRATDALEQKERLLRFAIEQMPVPVMIAEAPDVRITHSNRLANELLGSTGKPMNEIQLAEHAVHWPSFYPDGRPYDPIDLPLARAVTQGQTFRDVEILLQTPDGDRWLSISAAPLRGPGDEVLAGIVVFPDITDRKLTEARFRNIVEHSTNLFYSHTPEGELTYLSPQIETLLGFGVDEAKIRWMELTTDHPINAQGEAITRRAVETGVAQPPYELELRHRDGHAVWVEVREAPVVIDGQVVALVGSLTDITARKQALRELAGSERRFRSLFEHSLAPIMIADADGRYIDVNPAACRMFGYSREELREMRAADLVTPTAESAGAQFERYKQDPNTGGEFTFLRPDGEQRTALWSAAEIAPGEYVSVLRDVTEQRAMEAQLAQADRLSSMGVLAAGVAHELNNPLAYVLFNIESINEDLPGLFADLRRLLVDAEAHGAADAPIDPALLDDIQDRFAEAREGTLRIREVARSLSVFSRVEPDQLVPVHLPHAVEAALKMARNEVRHRAHLVQEHGQTPTVLASPGRLSQVFLNLIVNAAHAIEEGDAEHNEIHIRTWAEDGWVCAEVRDTGTGIDPAQLGHIFEPFFTTKDIGQGSGLGLSISRSIVEGYGGSISAQSRPGQGTAMTIRLPLRKAERAPRDAAPRKKVQTATTARILIVDDEPGIRRTLARMLKGHDTVESGSGAEAKQLITAGPDFDLILSDMMMPDVSGMDLHAWLAEQHPRLARRFAFITGGAFTPRARSYLDEGEVPWLEKPFDVESVRRLVARILGRSDPP